MSTPMYELPEHLWMGVDANGDGPVDTFGEADHWRCWCGVDGCDKPEGPKPQATNQQFCSSPEGNQK